MRNLDDLGRIRARADRRRRDGSGYLGEYVRHSSCFVQGDQSIANQAGAAFRGDLNTELQALVTNSQGNSAPGTVYRNQFWHDTTNNVIKRRNATNAAWLVVGTLDETFVLARSSNTILGLSDYGKTIVASSTFTQTFTAVATLTDGWWVSYRNDGTGVITLDPNGAETIDGAATIDLSPGTSCLIFCSGAALKTVGRAASVKRPVVTRYTSGSGTHTTTVGSTRMYREIVGGGGGGAAAKTNNGGNGGDTTLGSLTAGAGQGGATNGGAGGAGGAASGGDDNIDGGIGDAGSNNGSSNSQGGRGGSSTRGGAGAMPQSNAAGNAAKANSGSGGSGGGDSGGNTSGAGGGAGATVRQWVNGPAATYSYAVGAAGTGGAAGTNAGGAGAAGNILIIEYFD